MTTAYHFFMIRARRSISLNGAGAEPVLLSGFIPANVLGRDWGSTPPPAARTTVSLNLNGNNIQFPFRGVSPLERILAHNAVMH